MAQRKACLLFLLSLIAFRAASAETKLDITSVDDPTWSNAFSKQVDVFGVRLLSTPEGDDTKLLHAAGVMAQYLDNDADGKADNQAVVDSLRKRRATLIMAPTEQALDRAMRQLPRAAWRNTALQGLYDDEMHPGGAAQGRFDASLEEVLHLITQHGYAEAYPKVFGEHKGSQIAQAMDRARGGYFAQVPDKYPDDAWYTYDDRTCDYGCQITEYTYWALTSILGGQDFPGRLERIEHEWRLNTADKVKEHDPSAYQLLTDPRYKLPTNLPDGDYQPR